MTNEATSPIAPAPTVREATGQSVTLIRLVALGLLVAGVVNIVGFSEFPPNAPVEQVYAIGIALSLTVTALVLFLRSFVIARRPAGPSPRGERVGALTILAVVFGAATAAAALLLGGAEQLGLFLQGARLRYMYETEGVFFFGIPWVLGIAFGAFAFRRGGGRPNTLLAIVALVLGALVAIPTIAASLIYGLGLSD
ncbi:MULTISPECIES: hypothetical protein [Microbacteriaceae]|uniref:hypothetical protein n=1 Tax=Microbacteriaceae TaxID=85023 RepID=UPI0033921CB6